VTVSAPVAPSPVNRPAPSALPASLSLVSGARLTIVPVAASLDPLVDTVPHPVVKLFPMPVAEPAGEEAVFADVDLAREQQATAELAAGAGAPASYHGRHSA
jgi:hypothetical protein